MKNYIKGAIAIAVTAFISVTFSLHAATSIGVIGGQGIPSTPMNSAAGSTNSTTLATNGLYSAGLTGPVATSGSTTETNLILINPGLQPDGDIILQLSAASTIATGATNTITWTFSDTVLPATITNSIPLGNNASGQTRGTFASYTLALNGTSTVTTNIVLSKFSTPAIANGLNIYLESVAAFAGTTATNYSVSVVQ